MIIGIDPDLDKSGVAYLETDTKRLEMKCLTFVQTLQFIKINAQEITCVYIEAGWFNKKSNFHGAQNISIAARIGKNVGENHAAGKLLAQCIENEQIKVVLVKPTKKNLTQSILKTLQKYPRVLIKRCAMRPC